MHPFLQETSGLECGHLFCKECWDSYLRVMIMCEGRGQVGVEENWEEGRRNERVEEEGWEGGGSGMGGWRRRDGGVKEGWEGGGGGEGGVGGGGRGG